MSFFKIREAVEEYISEYILQEGIDKSSFYFDIELQNKNLIINLKYDPEPSLPSDEEEISFLKEYEMYTYDYDVVMAYYNDDNLNVFLDDTLLPVLPILIKPEDHENNKFLVFLKQDYLLSNGKKYTYSISHRYFTASSTIPAYSPSYLDTVTNSMTAGLYPMRDDKYLTFKVSKNRPRVDSDLNQKIVFAPEFFVYDDWVSEIKRISDDPYVAATLASTMIDCNSKE